MTKGKLCLICGIWLGNEAIKGGGVHARLYSIVDNACETSYIGGVRSRRRGLFVGHTSHIGDKLPDYVGMTPLKK